MNRTGIFLIIAVGAFWVSCTKEKKSEYDLIAETISVSRLDEEMMRVRDYVPRHATIAHRGTTWWAPEETESSWRWARHIGADYLEADLQCSKDAIILAIHDDNFRRTTDIQETLGDAFPSEIRRIFYRSFRNSDGTQYFSNQDIEAQVYADSLWGVNGNARDYYYAEILMLDAGAWFNKSNPERARQCYSSDGKALERTMAGGTNTIVYSNGQYVSTLSDLIEIASGQILRRDSDGRRILPYKIKDEYIGWTLGQIRDSTSRYMDFVQYDFDNAYCEDRVICRNKPGIYIEFKSSALQPTDIESRTFDLLDHKGWNIITKPSSDKDFYKNGVVNVGNTNGKVVLQSFRLEAIERVEKVFKGKVPMCYLIDDEKPSDWDPDNYFDDPKNAANVIEYMIRHKCHIIGPSVSGAPNNYPERSHKWQLRLINRSGMLSHVWTIDGPEQMDSAMDGMFTNRTDMTLNWLIDNGLRTDLPAPVPAPELLDKLGY